MRQKQQVLLLEDVEGLGNKGQISSARTGYFRNFLYPKQLAIVVTENMHKGILRMQSKLKEAREIQAVADKKVSEELKGKLESVVLEIKAKVDPDNRMYGSVTPGDIAKFFNDQGFPEITRNSVCSLDSAQKARQLKAIKEVGTYKIVLNLKEGVQAHCNLIILAEGAIKGPGLEKVVQPILSEEPPAPEETE